MQLAADAVKVPGSTHTLKGEELEQFIALSKTHCGKRAVAFKSGEKPLLSSRM